jgi:hypothetical protein
MPRRGTNRAGVARANKNARIAWVLLATDHVYTPEHSAAEGRTGSTAIRTPATRGEGQPAVRP